MKKAFAGIFLSLILLTMGCQSTKDLLGFGDKKDPGYVVDGETVPRFSENSNLPTTSARDYKRMTRQRMEEESQVNAQAGSMWVMEGQGAYLFSQNKTRREGDMLNVKMEGAAQQQVDIKVGVIKKLLKQLEEEERKAKEAAQGGTQADNGQQGRGPASTAAAPTPEPKKDEKEEEVKIESVPSRIVERQPDGNYRIKGQQPFMIGKKEYKVIVTGIIRAEDFNDEGLSSNKLLDPQYDVVSLRRKEL